ncbi:MAG: hypothetical protein J7L89_03730 [Bacteroidales bacterium]|nr:hypothetical protein [Bacteroidales bacterium]
MPGKQQIKSISNPLHRELIHTVIESVVLVFIGAAAIWLHARWRWGISIPGHHGLEFMILLMTSRIHTRQRFSSLWFMLGAGLMIAMPFMGFKNPVAAVGYLLPAVFLDAGYLLIPRLSRKVLWLMILGGLAYLTIPLYRLGLSWITSIPYPTAIRYGTPLIPLAGFLVFGMAGSFLGAGFSFGICKRKFSNHA